MRHIWHYLTLFDLFDLFEYIIFLTYLWQMWLVIVRADSWRCRFKYQWRWRRHTWAPLADFGSWGRPRGRWADAVRVSISRRCTSLHLVVTWDHLGSPGTWDRTVSCSSCQGQGASVLCTACLARICWNPLGRLWSHAKNIIQPI